MPIVTPDARKKLISLFSFLKAVEQRRTTLVRTLDERPWKLRFGEFPTHEAVKVIRPLGTQDFSLEIHHPTLADSPPPPASLDGWLSSGWEDPSREATFTASRKFFNAAGETCDQAFNSDPDRVQDSKDWQKRRESWAELERPAREVMRIWEQFFALRSQIEREGEALELVVGDGLFVWGGIRHPLLLRRVELEFTPSTRTFRVKDSDASTELYAPVFADEPGLPVRQWQQEVLEGDLHPLDGTGVSDWLKALTGAFEHGVFMEGEPPSASVQPNIGRAPVLFLRKRESGRLNFIDTILNDLNTCVSVPDSLLRIVGCASIQEDLPPESQSGYANEDADILLTKLANPAQLNILRRLSGRNGVLVQGPPGTGKTHTIANLIGHLLAEGKTVLVTSHTTKALRVLREQVVAALRPLCVSVLDSDLAGKRELDDAVKSLAGRLDDDAKDLDIRADEQASKRQKLLKAIQGTRRQLETAINGEYHSIVLNGRDFSPVEAAKWVAEGENLHDWIPGGLPGTDAPAPLSREELLDLYASNSRLTPSDERDLATPLPPVAEVMSPQTFHAHVRTLAELENTSLDLREDFWQGTQTDPAMEHELERAGRVIAQISLSEDERWRLAVLQAGMEPGSGSANVWQLICENIEEVVRRADAFSATQFRYAPTFVQSTGAASYRPALEEIVAHLCAGKSLGWITLNLHPAWKRCIESCRVAQGQEPTALEHFQALLEYLELNAARNQLIARWQGNLMSHGLPPLPEVSPEAFAKQFVAAMQSSLAWHADQWEPLERALKKQGLDWDRLANEAPQIQSTLHRVERLRHVLLNVLPETLEAERNRRRKALTLGVLRQHATLLNQLLSSSVIRLLREAFIARDVDAYAGIHARLIELHTLQPIHRRRCEYLEKVRRTAPDWANQIERRQSVHGADQPPGDLENAWLWQQLRQELDRRAAFSVPSLQKELEDLGKALTETTEALVEHRAWSALIRRVSDNDSARQALNTWSKATKKLGAGTGMQARTLMREAARQMGKARTAVPVWIMPFSRLSANFDPVRDRFDVLIVDEASQEDVVGLATFYMADKVIVVGDDEQVTPLDVGGAMQPIQDLIQQWLGELPDQIFDLKTSIYDRAQIAFRSTIRLTEHYRCVPEIIQFSNGLSYNWTIRPLRESASTPIKPALVAHRVEGNRQGKKNFEEADTIAALIAAAIEQPEYAGKTFGVISLVGDEQAKEIETRLRTRLNAIDYEKRRILCGNPAHFQGDERDVIFLSMVDSRTEGEGPLGKRGDGADGLWKKRYNVAVSRAKDQLWVVYSLDHATQLKPEDLRRDLIEHALNPDVLMRKLDAAEERTESPFEAEVYKILATRNFRVRTQWAVGAYRIDMVVEGFDGKRLAIECDGDRWHYDKVAEDLERQALLERLGWRFARIRGSAFYRNRTEAMTPVFNRLHELGIEPIVVTDLPEEAQATTALLETVKRRAEELHTDWFPSKQTTVNPVPVTIAPAVVSAELPTNQDSPPVLGDDLFGP